jgi:hypothetical protein
MINFCKWRKKTFRAHKKLFRVVDWYEWQLIARFQSKMAQLIKKLDS